MKKRRPDLRARGDEGNQAHLATTHRAQQREHFVDAGAIAQPTGNAGTSIVRYKVHLTHVFVEKTPCNLLSICLWR